LANSMDCRRRERHKSHVASAEAATDGHLVHVTSAKQEHVQHGCCTAQQLQLAAPPAELCIAPSQC
jgi:hypothetical protein